MLKVLSKEEIEELKSITKKLRANIVRMIHNAQSGHPGGAMSCIDILTVLYTKVMKHYKDWDKNPDFANRDRFVLSKGHASAGIYAILAHCGYFSEDDLLEYRKFGTKLQGHPCCTKLKGIEVSTGSLGQGLSIACGMALGLKLDKKDSRVYALMGDGELQEGSIWEAAMNAAHYKLDNLVGIVDRNRLQIDGDTEKVMSVGNAAEKFAAFGWNTIEIDGHNFEAIYEAFEKAKEIKDKPTVIIANTIKGKGVSFMENQAGWHGKAPNDEQLAQALEELK